MNDAQQLKAFGHLPGIELKDTKTANFHISTYQAVAIDNKRCCLHPDLPDQEIADSDPDTLIKNLETTKEQSEFLIEAHKRMCEWQKYEAFMEATGRGSFPSACYPSLYPTNHACRVLIEYDSFPSHYTRPVTESELTSLVSTNIWGTREKVFDLYNNKPMVQVAMMLTDEAFRKVGCAHIQADDGPNGKHNIHIKAENIPGSVIGYAFYNNQTCGDHVNNRIDSSWRPNLFGATNLICHECGHNHNLPHTFSGQERHQGIMSYNSPRLFYGFSTGKSPHTLPRDPSWDRLSRFYGGEEVPGSEPDPDPDPDPVPDSNLTLTGTLELKNNGKIIDEFICIRKPKV